MYRVDFITIFPDLFNSFLETSIVKRAQLKKKAVFCVHNLRDFTDDAFRTVDDSPYGGGSGMVLKPEPLFKAVDAIKKEQNTKPYVILLSPQGKTFNQKKAKQFANKHHHLIMLCGRYEGIDERVMKIVDEEVSIGDYVLSGGELPAMVVAESVVRLIPGVLGKEESFQKDSFYNRYLDYPHYTRPSIYRGVKVPKELLSGDHKGIETWRKNQALLRTFKRRPDILKDMEKSAAEDIIRKKRRNNG